MHPTDHVSANVHELHCHCKKYSSPLITDLCKRFIDSIIQKVLMCVCICQGCGLSLDVSVWRSTNVLSQSRLGLHPLYVRM